MNKLPIHQGIVAEGISKPHKIPTGILINVTLFWTVFPILLFLGGSFLVPLFNKNWASFCYGMVGTLAAIITIVLFCRPVKLSFRQLKLIPDQSSGLRFIYGVAIGSFIFACMISVLMLFTDLRFQPHSLELDTPVIIAYIAIVPLALMEELIFRSYSMMRLLGHFNLMKTQILTAVAFAIYHMIGGQSVWSALLGPGAWAFVFGLAAVGSRGIAMPLGIHVAINILQTIAGMKGKTNAAWIFDYPVPPTPAVSNRTDLIGIMIHVVFLATGLLLTWWYQSKSSRDPSEYSIR